MTEGPVLIVCPAILRFSWAEELERWLPFCSPSDFHLGTIMKNLCSSLWLTCCVSVGVGPVGPFDIVNMLNTPLSCIALIAVSSSERRSWPIVAMPHAPKF